MSEQTTTATPAANGASGGLTAEQVTALVTAAVGAAIKPLRDENAALRTEFSTALANAAKGQATPETIAKLVGEQLTTQQAAAQATAAKATAKSDATANLLRGIPGVYHKLGDDPAKWPEEATAAKAQYLADLKAAGITPPPVTSTNAATGTTAVAAAPVDSGLKGSQLIAVAVKASQANPVAPGLQAPPLITPAQATAAAQATSAAITAAQGAAAGGTATK